MTAKPRSRDECSSLRRFPRPPEILACAERPCRSSSVPCTYDVSLCVRCSNPPAIHASPSLASEARNSSKLNRECRNVHLASSDLLSHFALLIVTQGG